MMNGTDKQLSHIDLNKKFDLHEKVEKSSCNQRDSMLEYTNNK